MKDSIGFFSLTKKYKTQIEVAFIIVEAMLLYVTLFGVKWQNEASFSMIFLCFIFALLFFKNNPHAVKIVFALLFTLISDLFLVILLPKTGDENFRALAMLTFFCAQLCYFIYLLCVSYAKNAKKHIVLRVILTLIGAFIPLIVLGENANFLAVISVCYYLNLILNCVYAFIAFKSLRFFAIGLLLFICCDTFVGVQVGSQMFFTIEEGSLLYKIFFADFNFIWLFYGFSQTLIALSVNYNKTQFLEREL